MRPRASRPGGRLSIGEGECMGSRRLTRVVAAGLPAVVRSTKPRSACDRGERDLAAGAGLVEDDKPRVSAEPLLDEGKQLASHDVGPAARGEANDDPPLPILSGTTDAMP